MSDDRLIPQCLALLETMRSSGEWNRAQAQVYALILRDIGPELARAATERALRTLAWRPAPAELRRLAADIASPVPSVDEAYAEIIRLVDELGLYGVSVPGRPNIRLPGAPPFSHPLVAGMVESVGGWRAICDGSAQMSEGLSKQLRNCYSRLADDWRDRVADALARGPIPPELTPPPAPPRVGRAWRPAPVALPAPREERLSPMPEHIRRQISRIGRSVAEEEANEEAHTHPGPGFSTAG